MRKKNLESDAARLALVEILNERGIARDLLNAGKLNRQRLAKFLNKDLSAISRMTSDTIAQIETKFGLANGELEKRKQRIIIEHGEDRNNAYHAKFSDDQAEAYQPIDWFLSNYPTADTCTRQVCSRTYADSERRRVGYGYRNVLGQISEQ